MKKSEVFPSKYLKAEDLNGRAITVTIATANYETLKNPQGEESDKIVLHFKGAKKGLPLNMTNFDSVALIAGDDTDDWPDHQIELYPSTTQLGKRTVACVRIRQPEQSELPKMAKQPAAPPLPSFKDEMDDAIPF